ncbi:MBL fold metallo-hydrolase [Demequina maris]|uniref:MBL fold metallo-hydrolase n=1 Tax=Demequina maris TaxID=1638982 RepID=UPI0007817C43|nr:MBL fold metallo-hydrolase [Demequina maris]
MRLTKHVHACVEIAHGGDLLLIDPGAYTPDAAELLDRAHAVLLTHAHPDHVHADAIAGALASRPGLRVYGPASALAPWAAPFADRATAVEPGDAFRVGGLEVTVHGGTHAVIHPDLPGVANLGYLVGDRVFHPGDSYEVPAVDVELLLVPVSGPWMKLAEAVDFVRAVAPCRAVGIHELAASDFGMRLVATRLGEGGLTPTPVELLAPGEAIEV